MQNQILGMNSDELTSHAIKIVIGVLVWLSARYLPPDVGASLSQYIPTIAAGVVALGAFLYGVYRHANMKLVPENSTAIATPAPMAVGSTVPPSVAAVAKVVGVLLIGFVLLSLMAASPASAQLKPLKPLTGDLAKDLATSSPNGDAVAPGLPSLLVGGQTKNDMIKLWQAIQKASTADLSYAIAMATLANKQAPTGITTGAAMRLSCLMAIQTLNGQIGGTGLMDTSTPPKQLPRPDPALFTDAETFAEVIDAVQPGGPLWTSCSGAAQLAATSTVAFVNALVSGAAGLALLAPK